jgi:mono/diheme cytochrome c family protein
VWGAIQFLRRLIMAKTKLCKSHILKSAFLTASLLSVCPLPAAGDEMLDRGKYLVTFGGCGDCHTPGALLGKPDMARMLGGSDVGFEVPGLGTFYGPNLTPDSETGLGKWSKEEIVAAVRTGVDPEGRQLAPSMPWRGFAVLTDDDAFAIAAYLQSLPPVVNQVPGPFGPNEKATAFVLRTVPPG